MKVWRLETWIEKNDELDEGGNVRPATAELHRWMATAEKASARLGFDPVSRYGLGIASLESHRRMRDPGAEGSLPCRRDSCHHSPFRDVNR